jgi:hypothetical protein
MPLLVPGGFPCKHSRGFPAFLHHGDSSQGEIVAWVASRTPTTRPTLSSDALRHPSAHLDWSLAQAQSTLLTTTFPRNSSKETPRITKSLSTSFFEHTRREGLAANSCIICNASFQNNSGLEGHAKSTGHLSYSCVCDTLFGRFSSLARHVNSNTGSGYHCGLCENRTLPRLDKLYDHLRDGHKVSQKVLDQYRNEALGRVTKNSRPIKPAPLLATTQQVAHAGVFDPAWVSSDQINAMAGQYGMNMTPSSSNGVNPAHLTVRPPHETKGPGQDSEEH